MTEIEKKIAWSLNPCNVTYLPGCFDKRFARQLPNWHDRGMTYKGRGKMIELFHKYRRQIPDYQLLKSELEEQTNF